MRIIQSAKSHVVINVPGLDLGPGTSSMLVATCTMDNPVTTGNSVVAFVAGRIAMAGSILTLGPPASATLTSGGSSAPTDPLIYIETTYTDSAGNETMAGPETAINVPTGQSFTVFAPRNPNLSGSNVPGAIGWNVYASTTPGTEQKQNTSPLAFTTNWIASSVIVSGIIPPTSPVDDSGTGNTYEKVLWVDANYFGTLSGGDAIGIFACASSGGGTPVFRFAGYAHNANPIFEVNVEIDIILFEVADFSDETAIATAYLQQKNNTGAPTLTMTGVGGKSIVSHWSTIASQVIATVDFVSAGKDVVFAAQTGEFTIEPVLTPSINIGRYRLVEHIPGTDPVTSAAQLPLYIWLMAPVKARPQLFVHV